MSVKLIHGDCLEEMPKLIDEGVKVDLILTDLPYGTTACKWDNVIPFKPMWDNFLNLIKNDSIICLFGNEPFSSRLRLSNIKNYRYDWKWDKLRGYNFQQANYAPMRNYEDIIIFSKKPAIYNKNGSCRYYPIKTDKHIIHKSGTPTKTETLRDGGNTLLKPLNKEHKGFFPKSIIQFKKDKNKLHPTQKPVALLEYLIRTYTHENDLVLDCCMGSGSTGVACRNLNRDFIGIELDPNYYEIATERIMEDTQSRLL